MSSFIDDLEQVFHLSNTKRVSPTDINKGAYVVDKGQKAVMAAAGITPGIYPDVTRLDLIIAGTDQKLDVSYYDSVRAGSGRLPETRMGRGIIDWLDIGDELMLATDGKRIFAHKVTSEDKEPTSKNVSQEEKLAHTYSQLDIEELLKRAKGANPKPKKRKTTSETYERDLAVKAWAIKRSSFKCEMPNCDYEGFTKADGTKYIETHHIIPLSENGEDSIKNIAALCPNCHKLLHYASNKDELAKSLQDYLNGVDSFNTR